MDYFQVEQILWYTNAMKNNYKTIDIGRTAEIVEKKSRFIATVASVNSEEEATTFIEAIKKQNWNATHNCSAFIVGERGELLRQSDDGEPSGTAGKPMLDVLQGAGLTNVAVVVTRYFGGTLLGTGGLVQAYSKATQEGLAASTIIERVWGVLLRIKIDYNGVGKIQYFLGERHIPIIDSIYAEDVQIEILIPCPEADALKAELIEVTNGKVIIEDKDEMWYTLNSGKEG